MRGLANTNLSSRSKMGVRADGWWKYSEDGCCRLAIVNGAPALRVCDASMDNKKIFDEVTSEPDWDILQNKYPTLTNLGLEFVSPLPTIFISQFPAKNDWLEMYELE